MTEKTAWADLPNAKHIDRIVASVRETPEKWEAAMATARVVVRLAVWDAAWDAALDALWDVAADAARDAANEAAPMPASWAAFVALVAYDDCGYLLDQDPDHVKVLAGLSVESAVLLLPAVIALNT